jgi:hypothetical protein
MSGVIWKTGLYEETQNTIGLGVYPNPFTSQTSVSYTLQQPSDVTLTLYNLLGDVVLQKVIPNQVTGTHEYQLDAITANGLYLVKVQTDSQSGVQRILKQ